MKTNFYKITWMSLEGLRKSKSNCKTYEEAETAIEEHSAHLRLMGIEPPSYSIMPIVKNVRKKKKSGRQTVEENGTVLLRETWG